MNIFFLILLPFSVKSCSWWASIKHTWLLILHSRSLFKITELCLHNILLHLLISWRLIELSIGCKLLVLEGRLLVILHKCDELGFVCKDWFHIVCVSAIGEIKVINKLVLSIRIYQLFQGLKRYWPRFLSTIWRIILRRGFIITLINWALNSGEIFRFSMSDPYSLRSRRMRDETLLFHCNFFSKLRL